MREAKALIVFVIFIFSTLHVATLPIYNEFNESIDNGQNDKDTNDKFSVSPGKSLETDDGLGDEDAGDSFSSAMTITNGNYSGDLNSDTADYFKFDINFRDRLYTLVRPSTGDAVNAYIYDENQNLVLSEPSASPDKIVLLNTTASSTGTWFFKLDKPSDADSDVTYKFELYVVKQNDGDTNDDAGNTISSAANVTVGRHSGELYNDGDLSDFYSLFVHEGMNVSAVLASPANADFNLYLYDTSQTLVDWSETSSIDRVHSIATSTGYFYIEILQFEGSGTYELEIFTDILSDAETGGDASDIVGSASFITPGQYIGLLESGSDEDYYTFDVYDKFLVTIDIYVPGSTSINFYMLDDALSQNDVITGTGEFSLSFTADQNTQWYFVANMTLTGGGEYQFNLTLTEQNDAGSGGDSADRGNALPVSEGLYQGQVVGSVDESDYYNISLNVGDNIMIRLKYGRFYQPRIELYSPTSGTVSAIAHELASDTVSLFYEADESGLWTIRIRAYSDFDVGEIGTYDMNVTLLVDQDDLGTGLDAGDTVADALPLSPGNYLSTMNQSDPDDYYNITISTSQIVVFQIVADAGLFIRLYLMNSTGSIMAEDQYKTTNYEVTHSIRYFAEPGDYIFRMDGSDGASLYTLEFTTESENDLGTMSDAGDDSVNAMLLGARSSGTAEVNTLSDMEDWYEISVNETTYIMIYLNQYSTFYGTAVWLYLYNSAGSVVDSKTSGGDKFIRYFPSSESSNLSYYIRVTVDLSHSNPYGDRYNLTINVAQNLDGGQDFDADETLGTEFNVPITEGQYTGMHADDDKDFYYFTATANHSYKISITHSWYVDLRVLLYDEDSLLISGISQSFGNDFYYFFEVSTTVYINVMYYTSSGNVFGLYELSLIDLGSHVDFGLDGDLPSNERLIVSSGRFTGTTIYGDSDTLQFSVAGPRIIEINAMDFSGVTLQVISPSSNRIITSETRIHGKVSGVWTINIYTNLISNAPFNYTLYLNILPLSGQNDAGQHTDAGGEIASALALTDSGSYYGLLFLDYDGLDFYSVALNPDQLLSVRITSFDGMDARIRLLSSTNTELRDFGSQFSYSVNETSTVYIEVRHWSGELRGEYLLELEIASISENDAGSGQDAPNYLTDQIILTSAGEYNGTLYDLSDVYAIRLQRHTLLTFAFTFTELTLRMNLYSPTKYYVDTSTSTISYLVDNPGLWYFEVTYYIQQSSSNYTFDLSWTNVTAQDDAGLGYDAPNSRDPSNLDLISDGTYSGQLDSTIEDSLDYYMIYLPAHSYLNFSIIHQSVRDYDIYMGYLESGSIASSTGTDSTYEEIEYVTSGTDRYYAIWVKDQGGQSLSNYSLYLTTYVQNDAGSGRDAGNTYSEGIPIDQGSYKGEFLYKSGQGNDYEDYYLLNISRPGAIITITAESNYFFKIYLDSSTSSFGRVDASLTDGVYQGIFELLAPTNDTYRLYFQRGDTKLIMPYNFTVHILFQNDAGTGMDTGDNSNDALSAPIGVNETGFVYCGETCIDLQDQYLIDVPSGSIVTFYWSSNFSHYARVIDDTSVVYSSTDQSGNYSFITDTSQWFIEFTFTSSSTTNTLGNYTFVLTVVIQDDASSGQDAENSSSDATILLNPGTYGGELFGSSLDDLDYYLLNASIHSIVNITLISSSSVDTELRLFAGTSPVSDATSENATHDVLTYKLDLDYTYSIEIYASVEVSYEVIFEIIPHNDAGSGLDTGDSLSLAWVGVSEGNFTGEFLSGYDSKDFYFFSISSSGTFEVVLTVDHGFSTSITVYDDSNQIVTSDSTTSQTKVEFKAENSGDWTIYISGTYTGKYNVSIVRTSQNDAGSGRDAPDNYVDPQILLLPGEYTGLMTGDVDQVDVYTFEAISLDYVRFTVTSQDSVSSLVLTILDPGKSLDATNEISLTDGKYIDTVVNSNGTWTIQLESLSKISYKILFEYISPNDAGSGSDAGSSYDRAISVNQDSQVFGDLFITGGEHDESDFYSVVIPYNENGQRITLTHSIGDVEFFLYELEGGTLSQISPVETSDTESTYLYQFDSETDVILYILSNVPVSDTTRGIHEYSFTVTSQAESETTTSASETDNTDTASTSEPMTTSQPQETTSESSETTDDGGSGGSSFISFPWLALILMFLGLPLLRKLQRKLY